MNLGTVLVPSCASEWKVQRHSVLVQSNCQRHMIDTGIPRPVKHRFYLYIKIFELQMPHARHTGAQRHSIMS
jgi:hypothetical protein